MPPRDDPARALRRAALSIVQSLLFASARRPAVGRRPSRGGAELADYALLKREVKARGLLVHRPASYLPIALRALCLFCAGAWLLAWLRGGPLCLLAAPVLALATGQAVLLGHDAAHHAIFPSRRRNERVALLCINVLAGGSASWWTQSHNTHHAHSNDPDLDPDVDYPFFAFTKEQAARKDRRLLPLLRRQHVLAFSSMALVGLSLRVYSFAFLLRRRLGAEALLAALHFALYVPALVLALGPGWGLLLLVLQNVLFGYYVGVITAVNHWGMPLLPDSHQVDFLRHQITTSRNISGPFMDFLCGGLNRQIEHHLFPTMPRRNLPAARAIVRRFCAARGVPYHEVGLVTALGEIYRTLRDVARDPPAPARGAPDEALTRTGAPPPREVRPPPLPPRPAAAQDARAP